MNALNFSLEWFNLRKVYRYLSLIEIPQKIIFVQLKFPSIE